MKRFFYRVIYRIVNPFQSAYWYIIRPQTRGVKCLIERNGKFLMIRNSYGQQYWTFPGGGVKRNESPKAAAQRELSEEVGIQVDNWLFLGDYFSTRQYKRDTVSCFFAKVTSDDYKIDNAEVVEAAWFAISEIPEYQSPAVSKVLGLHAALAKAS